MNKKISLYVLVGAVALTGCNKKMQDFAAEHFTTNPNPLEVVGDNVPGTVTANVPQKFFKKERRGYRNSLPFLWYGQQGHFSVLHFPGREG